MAARVSHPTLKTYLAGIRFAHIEDGYQDPFAGAHQLQLVLRGIKRTGKPPASRQRLPITISVMKLLKSALKDDSTFTTYGCAAYWASFTLAFFAFFRISEFTAPQPNRFDGSRHLLLSDLSWYGDSQDWVTIRIKVSKTDPFRQGCVLSVFTSGHSICPVRAMQRFYGHRSRSRGCPQSPLFTLSAG